MRCRATSGKVRVFSYKNARVRIPHPVHTGPGLYERNTACLRAFARDLHLKRAPRPSLACEPSFSSSMRCEPASALHANVAVCRPPRWPRRHRTHHCRVVPPFGMLFKVLNAKVDLCKRGVERFTLSARCLCCDVHCDWRHARVRIPHPVHAGPGYANATRLVFTRCAPRESSRVAFG